LGGGVGETRRTGCCECVDVSDLGCATPSLRNIVIVGDVVCCWGRRRSALGATLRGGFVFHLVSPERKYLME
jgi:hypothetical protein